MKNPLTPKQVARAIGVSESSLKRWCDRGLIPTVRTAGGHRRLPLAGVLRFLRENEHRLERPEILGLPASTGQGEWTLSRAREHLLRGLVAGDETVCRQVIFDLYLAEQSIATICDEVIAEAFREIGDQWDCGNVEIYQERRGCEIASRLLFELQLALPAPAADAPTAIGGTPEGDPYSLSTGMVALALRDLGWRATSLGSMLPFSTLKAAVANGRPKLFWLSVSAIDHREQFLQQYEELFEEFSPQVAIVVGGRALTEDVRQQMRYAAYCDNLRHLSSFATLLHAQTEPIG
ncbi:MAG: helix-turn-helix domain-containing protein [Pirellulales bacterium]